MKKNNKGFTLAELLIVVAIIAVLVAVAIPVLTNQLEGSREATDAANIRSAYAEAMVKAMNSEDGSGQSDDVTINQQTAGWTKVIEFPKDLNTSAIYDKDNLGTGPKVGDKVYVEVAADGTVSVKKK